ncbi:hypothetical protein, partial [Staphylococcus aureus]
GETKVTSATDNAKNKPTAKNSASVDEATNRPSMENDVANNPKGKSTKNCTTDKPGTETDNA